MTGPRAKENLMKGNHGKKMKLQALKFVCSIKELLTVLHIHTYILVPPQTTVKKYLGFRNAIKQNGKS